MWPKLVFKYNIICRLIIPHYPFANYVSSGVQSVLLQNYIFIIDDCHGFKNQHCVLFCFCFHPPILTSVISWFQPSSFCSRSWMRPKRRSPGPPNWKSEPSPKRVINLFNFFLRNPISFFYWIDVPLPFVVLPCCDMSICWMTGLYNLWIDTFATKPRAKLNQMCDRQVTTSLWSFSTQQRLMIMSPCCFNQKYVSRKSIGLRRGSISGLL